MNCFCSLRVLSLAVLMTLCCSTVVSQTLPPPNRCFTAAKTIPFKKPQVVDTIANFTKTALRFRSLCSNYTGSLSSVWYQWTAPQFFDRRTQRLDITASYVNMTSRPTRIGITIFEDFNKVVDNAKSPILQFRTNGESTYYFQVITTSPLPQAFKFTIAMPPPPTDVIIDPLAGVTVNGTIVNAISTYLPIDCTCAYDNDNPAVTYKFTNVLPVEMFVVIANTAQMNMNLFDENGELVDGSGCGPDYFFLFAPANTSYTILVHRGYNTGSASEDFQLTVNGSPNYFKLIDPKTNTELYPIGKAVRYREDFTRMNFRLIVNDTTTKSVWFTFDNPRRSYCEQREPYSVFGDKNGNYINATIPLGQHVVTGTTYAAANCKGPAGRTTSHTFDVQGCAVPYFIATVLRNNLPYDCEYLENGYYFNDPYDVIPSRNINIYTISDCNGPVTFTLRNAISTKIVLSTTRTVAPFYLFGINGTTPNSGYIKPGNYTLEVSVDGIKHPPIEFGTVDDDSICQ
jgi:hypothetical protein